MTSYSERRRAMVEATMKDEVFRAATEVLREEGPEALTLERIARDVGISRRTLYNYFSDADAVMVFVERQCALPIADAVDGIARSQLPPERKLDGIARAVFDRLYENRAIAVALFAKREFHGAVAEVKRVNRKEFLTSLAAVAAEGKKTGLLRDVRPDVAAELFLGAISGLVETMLYSGEFRTADEVVPELMDVMMNGMKVQASRVAETP